MLKRYQIWDKESPITNSHYQTIPAEVILAQMPILGNPDAIVIISKGLINGAILRVLDDMKTEYYMRGCDFTDCDTNEKILEAIESFEESDIKQQGISTANQRIAAALEFQNLLSLEDVNV